MPTLLAVRNSVPFISAQEAADHCRVTDSGEFGRLAALVAVAVDMVEDYTGLALTLNTYRTYFDAWPTDYPLDAGPWYVRRPVIRNRVALERTPLVSVVSVKYYDAAGVQQTANAADYTVDVVNSPGAVIFDPAFTFPELSSKSRADAVCIEFTAGGNAPARARQAVLILVAHLYDNMGAAGQTMSELPFSVRSMLSSLRIP